MRISALIITSCKGLGTDEKHTVGDGFPVPRQETRPLQWRYLVQYRQNYNAK